MSLGQLWTAAAAADDGSSPSGACSWLVPQEYPTGWETGREELTVPHSARWDAITSLPLLPTHHPASSTPGVSLVSLYSGLSPSLLMVFASWVHPSPTKTPLLENSCLLLLWPFRYTPVKTGLLVCAVPLKRPFLFFLPSL